MHDNLRQMIRTLIEQELKTLDVSDQGQRPSAQAPAAAPVKEEIVSLSNDGDLAQFVKRIIAMVDDPTDRAAFENGRHRFRLASASAPQSTSIKASPTSSPQTDAATARFDRGVLTERACAQLAAGVELLVIGKNVRITPLAGDWLRRKRITIKRAQS